MIALITLKYTQSNSVCYVKDGQAIGIGAGQQSRIHCTRLAGQKADIWWLRQHPKVMALPFKDDIRRADRDNTIDVYISEDEHDDVLRDGAWQQFFTRQPEVLTLQEKREWIAQNTKVALGSDAFFPFGDNIERAHKSGVEFIAQAGGSVRDDHVIMTCDKYGIAMAFPSAGVASATTLPKEKLRPKPRRNSISLELTAAARHDRRRNTVSSVPIASIDSFFQKNPTTLC